MAQQKYIRTEYSDGSVVLSNVRDSKTNETYDLEKVTTLVDGTPLTDLIVSSLSPIYRKLGSEYFARVEYLKTRFINVKWFGAVGDGITDDTDAINKALATGFNTVIPDGDYLVRPTKSVPGTSFGGGIQAVSNQTIQFGKNATLVIAAQTVGSYVILNLRNTENVTVINPNIIGDVGTHIGTTGEYGMGIYIASAKNFNIQNPRVSKCWGDGIVVTNDNITLTPCEGGIISNALCDDNRRQGLSIISWNGGVVEGGEYVNTGLSSLTPPAFGIDIEPNPDGNCIINVTINNPTTRNNARGGIQVVPAFMATDSYNGKGIFNVTINNHISIGDNNYPLRINYASYSAEGFSEDIKINGFIRVNNPTINDAPFNAINIDRLPEKAPKVIINNPSIINCNTSESTARSSGAGINIAHDTSQLSSAFIEINNPVFEDNRDVTLMTVPIVYTTGTNSKVENLTVKNLKVNAFTDVSRAKVWTDKSELYLVKYDEKPINNISFPLTLPSQGAYNGEKIIPTTSGTVTLPNAAQFSGVFLTFEYPRVPIGNVFLTPRATDRFNLVGNSLGTAVTLSKYGDYIEIRAVDGIWEVINIGGSVRVSGRFGGQTSSSFIISSDSPITAGYIPLYVGEYYYQSVGQIWWKSYGDTLTSHWVPLNPVASETARGESMLATQAEVITGTNASKVVTPATLQAKINAIPAVPQSSETVSGRIEIATQAETNTGTDDSRAVTPLKLQGKLDTTLNQGALTNPVPVPVAITPQTASATYVDTELQQVMFNQEAINDTVTDLIAVIDELKTKLDQVITK